MQGCLKRMSVTGLFSALAINCVHMEVCYTEKKANMFSLQSLTHLYQVLIIGHKGFKL